MATHPAVRFLIPMRPISVNKMYRTFRGRTIKSREGREFEFAFNHHLAEFSTYAIDFLSTFNQEEHAIHVDVILFIRHEDYFTKSGRMNKRCIDVDNSLKSVIDQVFAFVDIDDGLVSRVSCIKVPSEGDSIEIILRRVEQPRKLVNPEPRAMMDNDHLQ